MVRIMGLDLGDKTIGVAISDPLGWTAQGVEVIRKEGKNAMMQRLQELVDLHEVSKMVVGLPRNMDGTLGERAEKSKKFAQEIQQLLSLPVDLWDERLSTVAAEKMLIEADTRRKKRKKVIDKVAATIILQNYLDAQSSGRS